MKCVMCGHQGTETRRENYPFRDLPGTVLKDVEVEVCPKCGERYLSIPRLDELMRTLAVMVINQESRLTGEEIRFLRGFLDLTQRELAERLGIAPATLSRAENGNALGQQTDRLLRMLVAFELREVDYADQIADVATSEPTEWRTKIRFKGDHWEPAA